MSGSASSRARRSWLSIRRLAVWLLVPRESGAACDVIVVLGAALTPDGRLGPSLAERVEAGVAAFHRGLGSRLIVTGAVEAGAMRARAVELGVPPTAILVEDAARTTRENAVASVALMRRHGLRRALVVTQRYHLRRSVAAFRRAGVAAEPLILDGGREPWRLLLREYLALVVYAARRWI
jgi:uncharacterized SAM-binding protein YcdF (DUF218 family)